jgi:hypothetical protein
MPRILTIVVTVLLSLCAWLGCASTQPVQAQSAEAADANLTDFKNPDPQIEALHVQAYNLDLGNGVPQDRVRANELYLQTAYAGDPRSMLNLAINLAMGQGIDRDDVEAFSWLDTARFFTQLTRDMKVKWRVRSAYDEMKRELTNEQLREAQQRTAAKVKRIRSGRSSSL